MTEYAPAAITGLFNTIKASIPSAILAGIIGDSAHTYGYHRGRNYVSGSDYSAQLAPDKKGDGEAASALDISWGNANDQYTVSQRLMNAKNDARMDPCREFYGSTDGRNVCGWDYYGNYSVTSDDSHLWHIHLSILRQYCNDHAALQGIASVIIGSGSTQPVPPKPSGDWFDMATEAQLHDIVKFELRDYFANGEGNPNTGRIVQATTRSIRDEMPKILNERIDWHLRNYFANGEGRPDGGRIAQAVRHPDTLDAIANAVTAEVVAALGKK